MVTGLLLAPAEAKTVTWTGASNVNSDWNTSANWSGGVPVNGDGLVFAAGARQLGNNNNLVNASFSSVSFAAGAGSYSLGQNRFTTTGAITNNSTNMQTLRAGVTVGGSQTWTGGAGGLVFNGINFANSGSASFEVSGTGLISSRGDITNATSYRQKLQMLLSVDTDQTWTTSAKGMSVSSLTGAGNLTLKDVGVIIGGSNSVLSDYAGSFIGALSTVYYDGNTSTGQTLSGSGSKLKSLSVSNGTLTLSKGSMALAGTGSALQVTGGMLKVNQGFKLDTRVGNAGQTLAPNIDSTLSDGASGSAVMQIGGVGTEFRSGEYFSVGQHFQGRLNVIAGASMINDGLLVIGRYGSSTAELHVESGASLTTNELGVGVGRNPVSSGNRRQSIGDVTVTGAGSVLTVATQLGIGGLSSGEYNGKGSVLISDKAAVNAGSVSFYNSDSSLTIDQGSLSTPALSSEYAGAGNIKLTNPTGGFALNLNSKSWQTYSGSISGTGSISKAGIYTQELSGTNSFTGAVRVTEGWLLMGSGTASSYHATGATAGIRISFADLGNSVVRSEAGGTVAYWTDTLNGGLLSGNGLHDVTQVTLMNGTQIAAGVTLALRDGATLTGVVSSGVLSQNKGQGIVLFDPDDGIALTLSGNTDSSFAGNISGIGGLSKTGTSRQVLAGVNTFTGSVLVSAGSLEMANSSGNFYQVAKGASLKLGTGNLGTAPVQADGGATVVYDTRTLNGGLLLGSGTHDVAKVTRYNGTSISNGVALTFANGANLAAVANAGTLTLAPGRTVNWTGGGNNGGQFNVEGTANVSGWTSSGVVQVGSAGTLHNSAGSNLVLLAGSRTYVGTKAAPGGVIAVDDGTSIELNGALLVNNGVVKGTTNVNYGSLAKGSGVYGAVNVLQGGTFEPGNSPGTVNTGAVRWDAGGSFLVSMDKANGVAGVNSGLWNIDGSLDITAGAAQGGQFTIKLASLDQNDHAIVLSDFNAAQNYRWLVAQASGGIAGFTPGEFSVDASAFLNPLGGGHFSVTESGNAVYLNFTSAVPEPTSAALLGAGLLVVYLTRRKTKQARA
ncbi:PEP-CTERM sorting domain-containing protein [Paucibacter sp. DJ1R-11]|uniref:beta strand repeat-containing protein n=1 Tax=Paucibacter sp. DJ1R-11 TaxID=2893556 RepID=UPI0021E49AA3|nr:autotransporter-associated beta strand repeat-containing protein [Paucibacter sp. DJ1R-11]MCV2363362.1 PEP-CTERM sorting domain-containing protein [Paucibacter sp. DJ1R-11]